MEQFSDGVVKFKLKTFNYHQQQSVRRRRNYCGTMTVTANDHDDNGDGDDGLIETRSLSLTVFPVLGRGPAPGQKKSIPTGCKWRKCARYCNNISNWSERWSILLFRGSILAHFWCRLCVCVSGPCCSWCCWHFCSTDHIKLCQPAQRITVIVSSKLSFS